MDVGDLNRDGVADLKDKTIVLNLLKKKVIKNSGGIGQYPQHSETAVHMDVRGWRARWDTQKTRK